MELDGQSIERKFVAELHPSGDGRTLDVRVMPYNVRSRVSDDGGRTFYEEEWAPGVFGGQERAANRVLVNFEHQQGIQGTVGRGLELRDTATACDGTFRMLSGPDSDKALELVNEGILNGVSVEAIPEKSIRDENGVVRRVKARLVNIALCRSPAFPAAQVLAVREKSDEVPEGDKEPKESTPDPVDDPKIEQPGVPDPPPPAASQEVDAMLARIGYEPLLTRAVVRTPWNGEASRFDDEQYKRSCLIDRGGDAPVKERCSLPVLEPNGDLNVNALSAAAARINQVQAAPEKKAAAARKLLRYYRQAGMDAPERVRQLAAR